MMEEMNPYRMIVATCMFHWRLIKLLRKWNVWVNLLYLRMLGYVKKSFVAMPQTQVDIEHLIDW